MSRSIFLTTTGSLGTVVIDDLGGVEFVHPVVSLDLVVPNGEFSYDEVINSNELGSPSASLQAAVNAGDITLTDASGNPITDLTTTTLPLATTTNAGIAELATQGEVNTATDDERIVTPLKAITGIKRFTDNMVINDQGLTSVATPPYTLSIQDEDFVYIEFLTTNTEGGADRGAFVCLENNGVGAANQDFALYNWQGGPFKIYTDTTPSSGVVRFNIAPNGLIGVGDTVDYETLVGLDDDIPNVKWINDNFVAGGDNLGNHTATQALDMAGFAVQNANVWTNTTTTPLTITANEAVGQFSSTDGTDSASLILNETGPALSLFTVSGADVCGYFCSNTGMNFVFGPAQELQINSVSGTSGQYLGSNGAGVPPSWQTIPPTDLSLGTITTTDVPINSSTGADIATLPAATATLAGIVTATAQTFGGRKTFNDDRIIIDPIDVGVSTTLEIGWFDDLTPEDPNSFGMRRTDGGGVFSWMNNAEFPQFFMGDPAGTGSSFIDATNNRPLNLNVLDTGVDDPGRVTVGIGGFTVAGSSEIAPTNPITVFRNDTVPILSFEVESDGTITAGATITYENLVLADNDIPNRKFVVDLVNTVTGADGSIDTHSDVDTTTTPPITGSALYWDGSNWVPTESTTESIFFLQGSCVAEFIDTTGLDFCNTQIGPTAGSAFYVGRRALGTIAAPTAIADATKIAGYSAAGYDGTAYGVGSEISFFADGAFTGSNWGTEMRFLTTPNGSTTSALNLTIESDGTLNVAAQTDYETKVTADDDIPNKKYVDDRAPYSIIRVTDNGGTDLTTNYNINGAEIALVLTGTTTNLGSAATDFTDANGTITCNFTGTVRVSASIPLTSTGGRNSTKSIIQQNLANYGGGTYTYIRNSGGHNRDSNNLSDIVSVTSGDTIRIGMRRTEGSTNGAASNLLAGTSLVIERLQ